jgi:hypothetical protein
MSTDHYWTARAAEHRQNAQQLCDEATATEDPDDRRQLELAAIDLENLATACDRNATIYESVRPPDGVTAQDQCVVRDSNGVHCAAPATDHPDEHVNVHGTWPVRSIEAATIRYATNMRAAGLDVTVTEIAPGQVRVSGRMPGSEIAEEDRA